MDHDAIVVGAGFYGCALALWLRRRGARVLVLEREGEILARASRNNQMRVHGGYHYPRSFLTALRSRVNYRRFVADYRDCIDDTARHYYAVARRGSGVTARQFEMFCGRIEAPCAPAPADVASWFDPRLVEAVLDVEECLFDPERLAARMQGELARSGVTLELGAPARRVVRDGAALAVEWERDGSEHRARGRRVLVCAYSAINELLAASGQPAVPLKHELAELVVADAPRELRGRGITVMCGPFFSVLPVPGTQRHTLSHVRYTPHVEWHDAPDRDLRPRPADRPTRFPHMLQDAKRYLPLLADCRFVESVQEVKTVLPQCELDDARPILLHECAGLPGLTTVMGSKIDNVYDVLAALQETLEARA